MCRLLARRKLSGFAVSFNFVFPAHSLAPREVAKKGLTINVETLRSTSILRIVLLHNSIDGRRI